MKERYFFLRGFAKNELDNISRQELVLYQKVGQTLLEMDSKTLKMAINAKEIEEVRL